MWSLSRPLRRRWFPPKKAPLPQRVVRCVVSDSLGSLSCADHPGLSGLQRLGQPGGEGNCCCLRHQTASFCLNLEADLRGCAPLLGLVINTNIDHVSGVLGCCLFSWVFSFFVF